MKSGLTGSRAITAGCIGHAEFREEGNRHMLVLIILSNAGALMNLISRAASATHQAVSLAALMADFFPNDSGFARGRGDRFNQTGRD